MCFEIHHTHKEKLMIFSLTCTNSTRHKGFRVAYQVEEVIYHFCIQYTLFLTLTTPLIGLITFWTINKSDTNMGDHEGSLISSEKGYS